MRKGYNEYTKDWNEVSKKIKDDAGWKCVRCGHPNDRESGHVLTCHHLDMDKSNNVWWNVPALCQKCHLQIQHKVVMEQPYLFNHSEWFKPYVAGYYANQNGLPSDKNYVMAHLSELLVLGNGWLSNIACSGQETGAANGGIIAGNEKHYLGKRAGAAGRPR